MDNRVKSKKKQRIDFFQDAFDLPSGTTMFKYFCPFCKCSYVIPKGVHLPGISCNPCYEEWLLRLGERGKELRDLQKSRREQQLDDAVSGKYSVPRHKRKWDPI